MPAAEIGLGLDLYHSIGDLQPETLVGVHGEALGVAAVAFDVGLAVNALFVVVDLSL